MKHLITNIVFNILYVQCCVLCMCVPEVLDESAARSEAADAEREKYPASGVGRLGRVLSQLFADLTVDLIPVHMYIIIRGSV